MRIPMILRRGLLILISCFSNTAVVYAGLNDTGVIAFYDLEIVNQEMVVFEVAAANHQFDTDTTLLVKAGCIDAESISLLDRSRFLEVDYASDAVIIQALDKQAGIYFLNCSEAGSITLQPAPRQPQHLLR